MLYNYKIFESIVNKDKKEEIFDYKSFIKDAWYPIIKKAKEIQHISFDLENNDLVENKILYFKRLLRKDQPVKYKINVSLNFCGGDWEWGIYYFKLQIENEYGLIKSNYEENPKYIWDYKDENNKLRRCYVIIPPVEAGNKLKKTEKVIVLMIIMK